MTSSLPPTTSTGSAPLQDEHDALPVGTRLGEFEILKVLGVGGFGIVYLAMDHALDRLVAVKEYMPSMMAARGRGTEVSVRSSMHQDTFNIGLRSFVNEAKLLARFNHPSLVKVYRFWEANGTAYMAMPFYPGRTLKDERRAMLQTPDETWLRGLVDPLLGAMEVLHKESVYHRDIAPDNILLLPDGPPVLLDFGAARAVIGDRTQSLTAVLKPSYAPIEQYADVGHLRQGPWTDLYALGAVLHFVVTGRPPKPSASRAVHDDHVPLTTLPREVTGSMPLKVLKAIDWALTVSPHTRPQNVQQFRDALEGRVDPPEPPAPTPAVPAVPVSPPATGWDRTQQTDDAAPVDLELTVVTQPAAAPADATIAAPPRGATVTAPARPPVQPPPASPAVPAPPVAPAPPPRTSRALPPLFDGAEAPAEAVAPGSRTGLMLGVLGAVLLVVVALGYLLLKDRLGKPAVPVDPPAVAASAAVPVIVAPATVPAATPATPAVDPAPAAVAPPPVVAVPNWSASAVAPPAATPVAPPPVAAVAPTASPRANPPPARPRTPAATPQAPAAAAATPRDVCNARATGSMSSCMQRVCTQGALVDHPQCVQLRRDSEW
jgi:serine/threonine protein kinase